LEAQSRGYFPSAIFLWRGYGLPEFPTEFQQAAIEFSPAAMVGSRNFSQNLRRGSADEQRADFGGTPPDITQKANAHDALQKQSNKTREQTNIKQINRFARHQRHHPVALDAQMSKHLSKTEVRQPCGLLTLTSHEQNGAWNDYDWICSRQH
jgi:hypothetical protein